MTHAKLSLRFSRVAAVVVVLAVLLCQSAARGLEPEETGQSASTPTSDGVNTYTETPSVVSEQSSTDTVTGQFYYKVRRRVLVKTWTRWTEYRDDPQEVLRYQYNEKTGENEVVKTTVIARVPIPRSELRDEERYITELRCVTLTLPADEVAKGEGHKSVIPALPGNPPELPEASEAPKRQESRPAPPSTGSPGASPPEGQSSDRRFPNPRTLPLQEHPAGTPTLVPATCRPKLGPAGGTIGANFGARNLLIELAPLVPVVRTTAQPLTARGPNAVCHGWVASEAF